MARPLRIQCEGGWYHITSRWNENVESNLNMFFAFGVREHAPAFIAHGQRGGLNLDFRFLTLNSWPPWRFEL
jgi:hypothetical protein